MAPPTRKPSPPRSAGNCSTSGSPNQTERIRRFLADDLKPELTITEAGQRYCALASPDLYNLLTVELRWTAEHHREWLTNLLTIELLR